MGVYGGLGRDFRSASVFTAWAEQGNTIVGTMNGGRTVRWVLDDDHNIVESAIYLADGRLISRAVSTLGSNGFPIAIRMFDSRGLKYDMEIQSRLNYDMDSSLFVPATIGIGLGNKLRDIETRQNYGWVNNQLRRRKQIMVADRNGVAYDL